MTSTPAQRTIKSRPAGRRLAGALLLALAGWLLAACGTALPTVQPTELALAASSSVAPLAEDLIAAYQAANPHVLIFLETAGGAQAVVQWTQARRVDLALITGQPPEGSPAPLPAVQVGWDALALIVHPSNPLPGLTLDQARAVFAGELQEWTTLGVGAGLIQAVSREDGSGARASFEAVLMGEKAVTPTALVMPGSRQMLDYVASHEQAIGYLSAAWVDERVRALPIAGLRPDPQTGPNSGYPLLQPVHLVAAEPLAAEAARFRDFALGPEGQAIIARRYGRLASRPNTTTRLRRYSLPETSSAEDVGSSTSCLDPDHYLCRAVSGKPFAAYVEIS